MTVSTVKSPYRVPFGKFRGADIREVMKDDKGRSYMVWAWNKIDHAKHKTFFANLEPLIAPALEEIKVRKEEALAKIKAQGAKSEHIGVVGDKMDFQGKVAKIIQYPVTQRWQTGYMTKVVTSDDNVILYWNRFFEEDRGGKVVEEGEKVRFSATIKAHEVDKFDVKSTTITRVKNIHSFKSLQIFGTRR